MPRRDNFFILIKYHYNPTTNDANKKPLPVLMLDSQGNPLEFDTKESANEFCDIVIPSGMGFTRDFLNALSADGVIIVGGGSGTLSEVCAAYMSKKPMVAIRGFDSAIAPYIDGYVDHRKNVKIIGADTAKEAVDKILELIS